MSKLQVFKYTQRFPQFANLETMFTSDFMGANSKEVMEQLLNNGYDYVLIDSIVEVLDSVKEDAAMSQGQAEKWLIDLCVKNNEAENSAKRHTTFLLIQQVTKNGVFVGSNKLKHITDAHMEMKRDSERDGAGTYIMFSKNRNGAAGIRYNYRLSANSIAYDLVTEAQQNGGSFELAQGEDNAF
jgi:predicted ATP-dependent serine protease